MRATKSGRAARFRWSSSNRDRTPVERDATTPAPREAVRSPGIRMEAKLYVILGSHACRTGMLMLEHKGVEYERVELPTGLHPFALRLRGFAGNPAAFRRVDERPHHMLGIADRMGTVPALLVDGQRVKTNREIARFLDELRPDPPLFPADPDRRRAVEA